MLKINDPFRFISEINLNQKKIFYSEEYIKKFFVGLMDGDGSIQVNHWRKKNLQYRLIIKLKYCQENLDMLNLIKNTIGGKIRIKKDLIWVVDSKKKIIEILLIFKQYSPLTSRLILQLEFINKCILNNNLDYYLKTRNFKYKDRQNNYPISISYFNEWLSGFIEAEGCFSIRKNGNYSFSIGQKDDFYLIEYIKQYFNITSKTRKISLKINNSSSSNLNSDLNSNLNSNLKKSNHDFWLIETYNKTSLMKVFDHFLNYPLLGEKNLSLIKLNQFICKKNGSL